MLRASTIFSGTTLRHLRRSPLLLAGGLLLAAPWAAGCGGTGTSSSGQEARLVAASGPLPGYQGSESCMRCHAAQFESWQGSSHARTVHAPSEAEKKLLGQSFLCSDSDAKYVLGE